MESLFGGFWGPVCGDHWDLQDANVVCRQLGYDGALAAPVHDSFDEEGREEVCLGYLHCTGNESSLLSCSHDGWTLAMGVIDGEELPRSASQSIAVCAPTGMLA